MTPSSPARTAAASRVFSAPALVKDRRRAFRAPPGGAGTPGRTAVLAALARVPGGVRGQARRAWRRAWRQVGDQHLAALPDAVRRDHACVLDASARLRVAGVEVWLLLVGALLLVAGVLLSTLLLHRVSPGVSVVLAGALLVWALEAQVERDEVTRLAWAALGGADRSGRPRRLGRARSFSRGSLRERSGSAVAAQPVAGVVRPRHADAGGGKQRQQALPGR